ncbi:DUF1692-domain-containing protein [Hortaea werneckii]|uniref:Endoplasmic reticulum-Golgi intermediate compartment protein n=1 Tax=Hortaea werneckii TaxID=91943 RepID=A0A3M7CY62_HORWE|nr:DUF1692-domain-containing protein [Hortaea werneckii]KAI7345711.1 DUF1692-domain-containing protein [Hortaea werneckii]RMY57088.1 hypothetical protein D0863_12754 [Hortaea werneckii]
MNGSYDRDLDESFGEKDAASIVKAFDAFPKTKPSYTQQTSSGGKWTIFLVVASIWLATTELGRWWKGDTTHEFSVEQGVGHDLQINLDVVVAMKCEDLHVNVQDASGDRILAGHALKKDQTTWAQWQGDRRRHTLKASKKERLSPDSPPDLSGYPGFGGEYKEEDVHDYLGAAKKSKKFAKTPRIPKREQADSCRIFGSMHGNKVQGDFHITARGHGYMEFGQHLDHNAFNFSHTINELSFGPLYPSLENPLDNTFATTPEHFYKYQYYLSVVPTIYTTDSRALSKTLAKYPNLESPSSGSDGLDAHPQRYSKNSVFTNQYAVTEQSHSVREQAVPGVFVKFDIEPIQLLIAEEWSSIPALFIRLVNVVSGVLVAGGWCYQITEWAQEVWGRRRRREGSVGMLNGSLDEKKG